MIDWEGNETKAPLRPGLTGSLVSVVFMSALFLRGVLKLPRHPLIFLLLIGDLILFASFLELLLTSDPVQLFTMPEWWPFKVGYISPQFLAVTVIILTLIGARAIAGLGIMLLSIVTSLHILKMEGELGCCGWCFIFMAYLSLVLQMKVPGMRFDTGKGMLFLRQLGHGVDRVGAQVKDDLAATGQVVDAGAHLAVKAVSSGIVDISRSDLSQSTPVVAIEKNKVGGMVEMANNPTENV